MRFDMMLCAAAAALLGGTLSLAAPAVAAQTGDLPIYEVASATPPTDRVIGPVRVRECRTDSTEARSAALARLSEKASSMGANGLVNVRVDVAQAYQHYIKNGMPNPCLYQTVARGDAAVLSGAGRPAPQLTAASK
ncbi:heavy metal-binding domain-containing protein [Phenylobacterium sp.]|uniref:heavy metal-binding domain-containing protein n=1 Tax=Phenylobacterium sp. TaxID=1871053 RepID=UPI002E31D6FB|nr:heavy metal-binding domain-containing protein [Phenylobacterium sp.]HEX3363899.1 heavy metal-binding domain-containing protein [Phenylobacterium sp.]